MACYSSLILPVIVLKMKIEVPVLSDIALSMSLMLEQVCSFYFHKTANFSRSYLACFLKSGTFCRGRAQLSTW